MKGLSPGRELYLSATRKIPRSMLVRYFERYNDAECNIESFSTWLINRIHTLRSVNERLACATTSRDEKSKRKVEQKANDRRDQKSSRSYNSNTYTSIGEKPVFGQQCRKCGKEHHLSECSEYLALPVTKRYDLARLLNLCICCLKNGHWAKDCRQDGCDCGQKHHKVLHRPKVKKDTNKQPTKHDQTGKSGQGESAELSAKPRHSYETHHAVASLKKDETALVGHGDLTGPKLVHDHDC